MSAGLAEGEVLLGRFTLIRVLDAEGASHIWVAEDADLSERVALRILDPGLATDRGRQERMRAACRRARQLRHPHIVPVFDLHRDGATCFISRGYIEGENLTALSGRPPSDIVEKLAPVLDALEYAHREGVVHGNLKATKILIDRQGNPRIADFLIAGALLDSVHPVTGPADDSARWKEQDLEALLALWCEIVTGEPEQRLLPERPRDLGELRRALAEAARVPIPPSGATTREEPGPPEKLIAPIRLGEQRGAASGTGSSNWLVPERRTWVGVAFVVLLAVAMGVAFWLPRWVETGAATEQVEAAAASASSQPGAAGSTDPKADPLLMADSGDDREAKRLLGEVLSRRDRLLERGAETWGREGIRAAEAHAEAGEKAQLESNHAAAVEHYRQASDEFAALEGVAEQRLSEALDSGASAFEEQDASEALRQYEIALGIDPGNSVATLGLARARTLIQAQSLMKDGTQHEREGNLEQARAAYAQALSTSPDWGPARKALDGVVAELADSDYKRRIAQTVTALAKNDLGTARQQVDAALALRPESSAARDLRRRVDQKELAVAIARGRTRAEAFEAKEEWRAAAEQYRGMLELDRELTFALEGFDRSERLASISEKFDAWIARPGLLYDERAGSAARELLEFARKIENPGPRLRQQIEEVSSLQRTAATPVSVTFESDGLTEVKIQRVGVLGAFARREVPLKPGTYVIMGIRRGFRDVRQTVTVIPGDTPPTVVVRCVEEI